MTGGTPVCMIHVYLVKGRNRFASNWLTLESTLSKVRRLRYLLQSLRISTTVESETFLEDLRALNPNTLLVGTQPITTEHLAEAQEVTITRVHQVVENLRIFVGYYQKPEEGENWVRLEMQPAWGEAAMLWERMGRSMQNQRVFELVGEYQLPPSNFETMNKKTIIS